MKRLTTLALILSLFSSHTAFADAASTQTAKTQMEGSIGSIAFMPDPGTLALILGCIGLVYVMLRKRRIQN